MEYSPDSNFMEEICVNITKVYTMSKDHPFYKKRTIPFWVVTVDKKSFDYIKNKYEDAVYRNIVSSIIVVAHKPRVMDKAILHISVRREKFTNIEFWENKPDTKKSEKFNTQVSKIIAETKKYYYISNIIDNETLCDINLTEKVERISKNLVAMINSMSEIYQECTDNLPHVNSDSWGDISDYNE